MAAAWTGRQLVVWGGGAGGGGNWQPSAAGAAYDPATDRWQVLPPAPVPARIGASAVWTGREVLFWGGQAGPDTTFADGAAYDPATRRWRVLPPAPIGPRTEHQAVWTGREMIVWGGYCGGYHVNTGARYDPPSNSWTPTSTTNAPDGRIAHAAVWTDSEMIVWGGYNFQQNEFFNTGGRYNPIIDDWTATSIVNTPSAREVFQATGAVWTGTEMIVWGGYDGNSLLNTGGRYCAQSGPTPRPRPTPHSRPTP